MIISIIYLVISFLLEGIMSNIFPSTLSNISYFTTIYIIISFAITYPYFDNDKKFFILIFIFGILFDILYTSTIFVNTFIFIIIGIVIKILYNILPGNVFMTNIISYVGIIIFHSIILYNTNDYRNMVIIVLYFCSYIIIHSIFMTIIYTSISYFIMKFMYNKFDIKYIK